MCKSNIINVFTYFKRLTMKSHHFMILLVSIFLFTPVSYAETAKFEQANSTELMIFLVRHAEKLTGDNPNLSDIGKLRAASLANMLADNKLTAIFSTDYNRTKETALAVALKQTPSVTNSIHIYNPSDLTTFSQQLLGNTGRYLVVGHSNTTTELVTLLGGEVTSSIDDKTEFDRLYILHISNNSTEGQKQNVQVTTTLLHY